MLFFSIEKVEIPELEDDKTNPPENHQDNGAMPPVNTKASLPYSPLKYASVASDTPPIHLCVEACNTAL